MVEERQATPPFSDMTSTQIIDIDHHTDAVISPPGPQRRSPRTASKKPPKYLPGPYHGLHIRQTVLYLDEIPPCVICNEDPVKPIACWQCKTCVLCWECAVRWCVTRNDDGCSCNACPCCRATWRKRMVYRVKKTVPEDENTLKAAEAAKALKKAMALKKAKASQAAKAAWATRTVKAVKAMMVANAKRARRSVGVA